MRKIHMATCVDPEITDIFENVCADSGVTVSSVLAALMEEFLDRNGADAQKIIRRAKQMRRGGRPKAE